MNQFICIRGLINVKWIDQSLVPFKKNFPKTSLEGYARATKRERQLWSYEGLKSSITVHESGFALRGKENTEEFFQASPLPDLIDPQEWRGTREPLSRAWPENAPEGESLELHTARFGVKTDSKFRDAWCSYFRSTDFQEVVCEVDQALRAEYWVTGDDQSWWRMAELHDELWSLAHPVTGAMVVPTTELGWLTPKPQEASVDLPQVWCIPPRLWVVVQFDPLDGRSVPPNVRIWVDPEGEHGLRLDDVGQPIPEGFEWNPSSHQSPISSGNLWIRDQYGQKPASRKLGIVLQKAAPSPVHGLQSAEAEGEGSMMHWRRAQNTLIQLPIPSTVEKETRSREDFPVLLVHRLQPLGNAVRVGGWVYENQGALASMLQITAGTIPTLDRTKHFESVKQPVPASGIQGSGDAHQGCLGWIDQWLDRKDLSHARWLDVL